MEKMPKRFGGGIPSKAIQESRIIQSSLQGIVYNAQGSKGQL